MSKTVGKLALGAGAALFGACLAPGAAAQQNIDEPTLSPMIFGETEAERRDRLQREREADETATSIRLSEENDAEQRGFFGALNFLVPEETNLSLGVGPVYEPDYYGSDDYEFNADPQVYIKVRNFLFLDDDGADIALIGFSRFKIGPSLKIRGRRDQDDNPDLFGLGDVGTTFEFGGFVATTFLNRFAAKARVRHGLKTGHRGTVVDGTLTSLIFRTGPLSLSASGRATWVGNRYADAYFSVTPHQSARSLGRLDVYEADAGFQNVGGSVTAYINIGDRWSVNPYASYEYTFDSFAETPIIADFGDRDQFRVGFHLMREFSFKKD